MLVAFLSTCMPGGTARNLSQAAMEKVGGNLISNILPGKLNLELRNVRAQISKVTKWREWIFGMDVRLPPFPARQPAKIM